MVKSCAKLDNGKLLIVLGIVAENMRRMQAGDSLLTDFSFAGRNYRKYFFALYDARSDSEAASERMQKTLADLPIQGMCVAGAMDKDSYEELKKGDVWRVEPGEAMPDIERICIFYGETEEEIEKMFRNSDLINKETQVIDKDGIGSN